jgi:hypothetical protein
MKVERKTLYFEPEEKVEEAGHGEGYEKKLKSEQIAYVSSIKMMGFILLVASVTTLLTKQTEALTTRLTFSGCVRHATILRQLKKLLKHKKWLLVSDIWGGGMKSLQLLSIADTDT